MRANQFVKSRSSHEAARNNNHSSSSKDSSLLLFWSTALVVSVHTAYFGRAQKQEESEQKNLENLAQTPSTIVSGQNGDGEREVMDQGKYMPHVSSQGDCSTSGVPLKPKLKPVVGTTTMRVVQPSDRGTNSNGHPFAKWRVLPGSTFNVRSRSYLDSNEKIPSPSELYHLVNVDIFESKARIPDISGKVQLPDLAYKIIENEKKTWYSPDIFVVSFALPTESPSIYKPSTTDGEGYTVTMYYAMKEDTRATLREITAPGYDPSKNGGRIGADTDIRTVTRSAVRLFEEWCSRSPSDDSFQARFKVIILGQNLKEIGIPHWIGKYNGKPFLIKRSGVTGFLYDHQDLSAMEFDISFHCFPYLFKRGTVFLKNGYFKKLLASFAFVIEGRNDEELPEVVIGEGMQICYPDPAIAIQAEDLFDGSNPSSLE